MLNFFKKIFDRSEEDKEALVINTQVAHSIKNTIEKDLIKVDKKLELTKLRHMEDLDQIQRAVNKVSKNISKIVEEEAVKRG